MIEDGREVRSKFRDADVHVQIVARELYIWAADTLSSIMAYMTSLLEQLQSDTKDAMKARDTALVQNLRLFAWNR